MERESCPRALSQEGNNALLAPSLPAPSVSPSAGSRSNRRPNPVAPPSARLWPPHDTKGYTHGPHPHRRPARRRELESRAGGADPGGRPEVLPAQPRGPGGPAADGGPPRR